MDSATDVLSYRIVYAGLTAPETAAHFHGFAGPAVPVGVPAPLPLGAFECCTWSYAAAQEPGILAGQTYVDIHSTVLPGGEIRGQFAETPIQRTFCHGDGSSVACPCGNNSASSHDEGRLHSGGFGRRLRGYAAPSISGDLVVMHALRLPPNTQGLLFQGTGSIPAAVFGDRLRCAGGNILRLVDKTACSGQIAWPEPGELPLSVSGAIVPPTVAVDQVWYRDPAVLCTAATCDVTNAVRVPWAPWGRPALRPRAKGRRLAVGRPVASL